MARAMPAKLKDPEARQRRNKASTAAELPSPNDPKLRRQKVPPLNAGLLGLKGNVKIEPPVRRWWTSTWQSPMAGRWLETDLEVLYVCALIRQQIVMFAREGKSVATLASELRQQESRVGLDVLARRRLDWRIEGPRTAEAIEEPEPEAEPAPREPVEDPRSVLRAVE